MDFIRYYLLSNTTTMKFCNQKKLHKYVCAYFWTATCSGNWGENRHSPQRKCQRICSACKIYFLTRKNMAARSDLILQMVMYFHPGSHVKPRRVKTCMQM